MQYQNKKILNVDKSGDRHRTGLRCDKK